MVKCGPKNRHQKHMFSKAIELRVRVLLIIPECSIVKNIIGGRGLDDHFIRKIIFTMTMNKNFI